GPGGPLADRRLYPRPSTEQERQRDGRAAGDEPRTGEYGANGRRGEPLMAEREEYPRPLSVIRFPAGIVGAIGAAILILSALQQPERFFQGYIFGYIFWLSLTLGCFALSLIQHMIRSSWGGAVLRFLEAGSGNLLFMFILTIPLPVAAWSGHLY